MPKKYTLHEMAYDIRILTQKTEMAPLYPLFRQLNPNVSEERYLHCLDDMTARGYRMVAVFEGADCVALSGIWTATKFYSGRYFELDNVVVDQSRRSAGLGKLLSDFIEKLALEEGIETLMLDAYRENFKAHIFYEREGYTPRGFHFVKPIAEWSRRAVTPLPERFRELDKVTRAG